MIHNFTRPSMNDAIEVESLGKIIRTLNDFPDEVIKQIDGRTVILFSDGENVVLVSTSGYKYPRYKTPRINIEAYEGMNDYALERLMICKATHDDVDYVIGGSVAVTK
jgi:hypothetical protein